MRRMSGWLILLGVFVAGCGQEYAVGYPEAVEAIGELYPEKREPEPSSMPAYSQTDPPGGKGLTVNHKEVTPEQEYRIRIAQVWYTLPDYPITTVGIRKSDKGVIVTVRSERFVGPFEMIRDLQIWPVPWRRDLQYEEECQNRIGQVLKGLAKGGQ